MGVYTRKDSPYYWMRLERPGKPALLESTKVVADAPTTVLRRQQRQLAEEIYLTRRHALLRQQYEIGDSRPPITFDAFAAWYVETISALKEGAEQELTTVAHLRRYFGNTLLSDITPARVQDWIAQRRQTVSASTRKTVSASTVNRQLDVLKHMLASAVPTYLEESPIKGFRRLRARHTESATLSRADEAKLLAVLPQGDALLVVMALDTLMRLSDLLALEWPQVHADHVTVLNPKTGHPYKVPLSRRLKAMLKAAPRSHRYVFHHRRTAEKPAHWRSIVGNMLERACEKAGVTFGRGEGGITFHALRHTGASRMVAAGVDLRTVQEIGGWSSLRQLTRYSHPTDAAKRRAVEAVSKG